MAAGRPSSRAKIVEAAVQLAKEVGAGHISLDAVARRAGVSKGGLLYHFPSKNRLLQAVVSFHLEEFERSLRYREAQGAGARNKVINACIDLFEIDSKEMSPASGFLAALAENPDLLSPVRETTRRLVDRIRADSGDIADALVVFMALEGLRCLPLLGLDVLTAEERAILMSGLRRIAGN